MNRGAKGRRAEHRARRLLQAEGYTVVRAAGSLGVFDLVALGPVDVRLLQVKAGTARMSRAERAAMMGLSLPPNVTRECWRFEDRCKHPHIEQLNGDN